MGHRRNRVTTLQLPTLVLTPETALRRAIEEYMTMRPELAHTLASSHTEKLSYQQPAETLQAELLEKQVANAAAQPAGRKKE